MSDQRHDAVGPTGQHKTDKEYLATRQYRDASNLNARGSLHARFGTNPYPWFRWLFDQLLTLAPADARIVEVGCGPAGFWLENLDRLPPGWRVTLTDLSEGMLTTARERLAAAGAPERTFTIQTADVESLPFADASFDVAVANHMLYHVPDRPKAFGELRRILKPGGALLAATNGQNNLLELDELLVSFNPAVLDTEWKASVRHPFKLENGAEQMAPFFDAIEIHLYHSDLRVTDVDAIVAYARSIDMPGLSEPEQQNALATRIHERMAAEGGVFTITKSVGAFTARARTEE